MVNPCIPSVFKAQIPIGLSFLAHEKHDQFITSLVHEIRNPLSTIRLAVEILQNSSTDYAQKRYINMIVKSNERINVLISQLLLSYRQNMVVLKEYPVH